MVKKNLLCVLPLILILKISTQFVQEKTESFSSSNTVLSSLRRIHSPLHLDVALLKQEMGPYTPNFQPISFLNNVSFVTTHFLSSKSELSYWTVHSQTSNSRKRALVLLMNFMQKMQSTFTSILRLSLNCIWVEDVVEYMI